MATLNGEEWLEAQLQSIASQTRLPERLVISDDGSTDRTLEITQRFAREAPFEVELLEGPSGRFRGKLLVCGPAGSYRSHRVV